MTATEPAAAGPLRVTVVTVAHRPDDARIAFRQIGALRRAGAEVCYVAPGPATVAWGPDVGPVERVVVTRATGRRRLRPWWQAFRAVRRRRGTCDIVLVHDLEAVLPVRLARPGCPVVWDVHEDMVASVDDRRWIPARARPLMRWVVGRFERLATARSPLLLAEHSYRDRFGDWPVVPNTTTVPATVPAVAPASPPYAIYVGRISQARGAAAMIRLGHDLGGDARVVLVGPADDDVRADLTAAAEAGAVDWRGPLPNPEALALVEHAAVGLCLLEPIANYVGSMPTKVYEYFARGVPAVVSPLPLAVDAVHHADAGTVVDPHDPAAVAAAVRAYTSDPDHARAAGRRGHRWVQAHHDWNVDGERFVATLTDWAATRR
ncbi:MAG TPA: glycosyltransferase [Ilumatobacter sp.]